MDSAVNCSSATSTESATSFNRTRPTHDSQIPDIPASVMIPPMTASSVTTTISVASDSRGITTSSSHDHGKHQLISLSLYCL